MVNFNKTEFFKELENIFQSDSKMTKIVAGIGALIFGPLAVYYFITEPNDYVNNFIIVFGFLGSVIWLFSGIRKGDLRRNEAYQEIRRENGNIVWIYPENTWVQGGTSFNLKIMNRSGKEFSVPTAQELVQQDILEKLSIIFPDALLGYTEENQKMVKQKINQ